MITPNEFQYVHHMLIYLCNSFNETEVGNSAPCGGTTGASVSECRQGSLIAGWAVGGTVSISSENYHIHTTNTHSVTHTVSHAHMHTHSGHHMHTHTHTHSCTHTYTHACTHTCIVITTALPKIVILIYNIQDFIYPDNVAYPLGGAGNPRFVVIEMHYDNPNQRSGK